MSSKKLRRVGLSPELCDRLSRYQIVNCQHFLSLSPLELMKVTGLSYRGVHELLHTVSKACAPQMQTAYELKTRRSAHLSPAFLSTTLCALDEALHGGVPCGSLTEITGPPGCGKTQFCIMMSVLATLPTSLGGLEGAVVYIDTESAFTAERLVEIAESRFPQYFNTEEKLLLTSSRVHLCRELTCEGLLQRLESLEEEIISKGVKLVIVDSIASVVRKEFDPKLQGNIKERNKFLGKGASLLKYLAGEFSIPQFSSQDSPEIARSTRKYFMNTPAVQFSTVGIADTNQQRPQPSWHESAGVTKTTRDTRSPLLCLSQQSKKISRVLHGSRLTTCLASAHESVLAKLYMSLYQLTSPCQSAQDCGNSEKLTEHHQNQKFFGTFLSMESRQMELNNDAILCQGSLSHVHVELICPKITLLLLPTNSSLRS